MNPQASSHESLRDGRPMTRPTLTTSVRARTVRDAATVIIAGLILGIGAQILQGVLPDRWDVIANSGAVWAVAAFILGAVLPNPRSAAIGGAAALVIAACSFYVAVAWFEGSSSNPRSAIIWSCVGVLAGAAFGTGGNLARRYTVWRDPGWALIAGALASEGLYLTFQVGNLSLRPAGVVELGIAALLITRCMIRAWRRALTAGLFLATGCVTLTAYHLINTVFAHR